MKLTELIASLNIAPYSGADVDIRGLAYDSRQVKPGYLFFAIPGANFDGHDFIGEAMSRGAAAVIVERPQGSPVAPAAELVVADARAALAAAAVRFYGYPSKKFKLIGITGTNGKTTTAYLLESIFRAAGLKTGLIGTIEYRIDGERFVAERTTPESLDLQRIFASMVDKGVEIAIIEVSSHALKLRRVDGSSFAARVFTNLSRDHLDFHTDMEDYFDAKARFFTDEAFGDGPSAVNIDDAYGRRLADAVSGPMVTFGLGSGDYYPVDIDISVKETAFSLVGPTGRLAIRSRLIGAFNLINLIAAAAVASRLGVDGTAISDGLLSVGHVPGRFETVACGQDFQVLVDYAHTPDGLEKVIGAARSLAGANRLIVVFGCGGDRDKGKRPKMGAIAAAQSDIVFVTSDNPRGESPGSIIDDILEGISKDASAEVIVTIDRIEAIDQAIGRARPGDVVLIAGKGHETYQILADRVIPFDDRRVARERLRELIGDPNKG